MNSRGLGGTGMKTGPAPCVSASHTPKMVLQTVLKMESPLDSAKNSQDLVQTTVLQFLHTLSRRPLSVTVKGIRKRA